MQLDRTMNNFISFDSISIRTIPNLEFKFTEMQAEIHEH